VRIETPWQLEALAFTADGLIPVIAQDARTGEVLMVAWANRTALEATLAERRVWFWSRQRAQLWRKGETSGHELRLLSLHTDCDHDALLALVEAAGPACHTGERTCFGVAPILTELAGRIQQRAARNERPGYTQRLLSDENLRLKKLGEEATELALACHARDREPIVKEAADLLYHCLVACAAVGVTEADILGELLARATPTPHVLSRTE
jgi:phosphoribosyl-ATP pyrophosphohydrolase/phosphoribosyl-AMP cyclohydrolase